MKYLITENQYNSTRKLIRKSINEVGFLSTVNRFKLNLKTLSAIFDGYEMPYIDCEDLFYFTTKIFKNKEAKTHFVINNFEIDITPVKASPLSGHYVNLIFVKDLETGYYLEGKSTPFFDGDCILPIDFYYFNFTLKEPKKYLDGTVVPAGEEINIDISGRYDNRWNIRDKFNSFSEIKDFLENEYPQQIEFYSSFIFDRLKERYNLK